MRVIDKLVEDLNKEIDGQIDTLSELPGWTTVWTGLKNDMNHGPLQIQGAWLGWSSEKNKGFYCSVSRGELKVYPYQRGDTLSAGASFDVFDDKDQIVKAALSARGLLLNVMSGLREADKTYEEIDAAAQWRQWATQQKKAVQAINNDPQYGFSGYSTTTAGAGLGKLAKGLTSSYDPNASFSQTITSYTKDDLNEPPF